MPRGNDERDNHKRRPIMPLLSDNPEFPHGSVSGPMSEIIKQAIYDSKFNQIADYEDVQ